MILMGLNILFLFSEECDDKSFGEECRKECGSCYDDTSCDHITGECPGECKDGWVGSFCNKSEQITHKKHLKITNLDVIKYK